jgi:hypothetical protein
MAGSNNDINMLHRTSLFSRLTKCTSPQISYVINDNPEATDTFVKTVRNPVDKKCKRFAKEQEAPTKDVERAFGVLQSRWDILRYPAGTCSPERMWNVMTACVIMHDMNGNNYDQGWVFRVSWLTLRHR